ncbi:Uncharacterised protein [Mycobacteroides abscessus subsp. massiliense]|nr:Uncharacterised protein [Mycobacteroides abscessus subsp. massiliense]
MFGKEAFGDFAGNRTGNVQITADDIDDVADHPAAEHHVIGHDAECAEQAHPTDQFPNFGNGFAIHCAAKRIQCVHAFTAADDVFHQNHRNTDDQHGDTEQKHIRAAAVFTNQIRETPSCAKADSRAGNGDGVDWKT